MRLQEMVLEAARNAGFVSSFGVVNEQMMRELNKFAEGLAVPVRLNIEAATKAVASEAIAMKCFEIANKAHEAYWAAVRTNAMELAVIFEELRDDAAQCKSAARALHGIEV